MAALESHLVPLAGSLVRLFASIRWQKRLFCGLFVCFTYLIVGRPLDAAAAAAWALCSADTGFVAAPSVRLARCELDSKFVQSLNDFAASKRAPTGPSLNLELSDLHPNVVSIHLSASCLLALHRQLLFGLWKFARQVVSAQNYSLKTS